MVKELNLADNAVWKQRYRTPVITWTQIAGAAPNRGLVATNRSGANQLYAWDVATGDLRQITERETGTPFGYISPDGRYVYYLNDNAGNEIGHIVRVPFEGGTPQDITPDLPPYSSTGVQFKVNRTANCAVLLTADQNGFHSYSFRLDADGAIGEPRKLYDSPRLSTAPLVSGRAEVAVLQSTERNGGPHFTLLAFDPLEGGQIAELWDGATNSLQAVDFSPVKGDCRLLASTDQSGTRRPLVWNPLTNERTDLPLPELQGDIFPLGWSSDATNVLLCQFVNARQQLYRYDLTAQKLTRLNHPAGTFGIFGNGSGYFADNNEIFVHWQDGTHPQQLIALDADTGEKKRVVLAAGDAPAGASWQSFNFNSSDGQAVQGWLALPAPREQGPFPTIFHTHGGPTAAQTEAFSPESQAWLDHGFAFVTINYRGSTTFGREFQDKINGQLGYWEVEDMVAARTWLVENGIADPDKILLTGRSYGGYLTLMGVGKTPDLWAGGMAVVAIADWSIQYEDTAPSLRGYQVALLGGTPQEKPEVYSASSPITYAENVRVPVQIIQGRNDTRTPARPIEMYEEKLKALGKSVEVHWFEAGHTGAGNETAIHHQELMLRFAYRVLGYTG